MRWVLWLAVASCGGSIVGSPDATGDATASSDAADEIVDAGSSCTRADAASCYTAPNFAFCAYESGAGGMCLGDAGDNCGLDGATCTYPCKASEYAASCGGPPPAQSDPPSTSCHLLSGLPNGSALYCCPCE